MQCSRLGLLDSIGSAADLRNIAEVISLELQVVDMILDVLRELLRSRQQILLDQVQHVLADVDALLFEPL